jgi:hypothetical protein
MQEKIFFANGHVGYLHFVFGNSKENFVKKDADEVGPIGKIFLFCLRTPLVRAQKQDFFLAQCKRSKGLFHSLDLIRRDHLHPLLRQVLVKIEEEDLEALMGLVKDAATAFGQTFFLFEGSLLDQRHGGFEDVFVDGHLFGRVTAVLGQLLHSQIRKGQLTQIGSIHGGKSIKRVRDDVC